MFVDIAVILHFQHRQVLAVEAQPDITIICK